MSKVFLTIIVSYIYFVSEAQSGSSINRIGIGDKVPEDMPLMNLVNHSKPNLKVSDYKGKWLILDYWFTGCKPCIESWPKLMQLQDKYAAKIQIMGVNHMQNKKAVEDFITRRNKGSQFIFKIPSVTGDTILYKTLPPSGYPSVVWIDPDGIYRATTTGSDLNEQTLNSVLENKQNFQTLITNNSFINPRRPLFIDGNGGTGQQMIWYSTVSKYSEKVADGIFVMAADSSGYVIAATHKPVLDLITRAYCEGPFNVPLVNYIRLPKTRIELDVKNAEKLDSRVHAQRVTDNLYTYQLISYVPRTVQQLKDIMKYDLEKYFHLELRSERKIKKCLVLSADENAVLGDNATDRPTYGYKRESGYMFIRNVSVDNFFGYLTEYVGGVYNEFGGYPLVNETGYSGGMDLVFDGVTNQNRREVFSDYGKLNSVLAKYGIQFKLEDRQVDVLIIGDAESK